MERMTFAEKLEMLRKRRGMSQGEVAAAIGAYQSRVSEWAGGDKWPKLPQAFRLAGVLGVSLDYLADDTLDEPPAPPISDDDIAVVDLFRALGIERAEALRRLARPSVNGDGASAGGIVKTVEPATVEKARRIGK